MNKNYAELIMMNPQMDPNGLNKFNQLKDSLKQKGKFQSNLIQKILKVWLN